MSGDRSYVTGYFGLVLDGVESGIVQAVAGDLGGDADEGAHGGGRRGGELAVRADLSFGKPVKEWLTASRRAASEGGASRSMRKSGEVKAADFSRRVRHIREFHDALPSEIGFPACDRAAPAGDGGHLTFAFHARELHTKP